MHNPNTVILSFAYCLLMLIFPQAILAQDPDVAYSGNYLIRNCNAGQPGSYAEQLQTLLSQIRATFQIGDCRCVPRYSVRARVCYILSKR